MAFTTTCTGVVDIITALKAEDEFHIQVTFKESGSYKVSLIMNQEAFASLKQMKVGQKVSVATNGGDIVWVETE